jgi:hypothetical protein
MTSTLKTYVLRVELQPRKGPLGGRVGEKQECGRVGEKQECGRVDEKQECGRVGKKQEFMTVGFRWGCPPS